MSKSKETLEDVKVNIRSLLITAAKGMHLQQFCNDYRKMIGQRLPCQEFGHNSPQDFLRSMPDVVTVRWDRRFETYHLTAVGCEETSHIEKLVSKQKTTKKTSGLPKRMPKIYSPPPRFTRLTRDSERPRRQVQNFDLPSSSKIKPQVAAKEKLTEVSNVPQKEALISTKKIETSCSSNGQNLLPASTSSSKPTSSSKSYVPKTDSANISSKMKEIFKSVLEENPDGVFCADFPVKYKEKSGYRLELKELGYSNLISLVDDLPNIFYRCRPEGFVSDWLLYDYHSPKARLLRSKGFCGGNKEIDEDIVNNMRSLLQINPEGLLIGDVSFMYKINFGTELKWKEYGYLDLESFFRGIADKVNFTVQCLIEGKRLVLDPSLIPLQVEAAHKIPGDRVLPGVTFTPQTLPLIKCDSYSKVRLVDFINPDLFWIQLKGQETSDALDVLLDRMSELYSSPKGDDYVIQEDHIVVGSICASFWENDGNWYRSSIIGMRSSRPESDKMDTIISVFHVDYGSSSSVPKSGLRYLKKEYLALPSQAIRGHMPCIKPPTSEYWTSAVSQRIMKQYYFRELYAEFLSIPDGDSSIPMWLCDCSQEKDIFLAQLLIEEGYGVNTDFSDSLESSQPTISEPELPLPPEPSIIMNSFISSPDQNNKMTEFIKKCQDVRQIMSKTLQANKSMATLAVPPSINKPILDPTPIKEPKPATRCVPTTRMATSTPNFNTVISPPVQSSRDHAAKIFCQDCQKQCFLPIAPSNSSANTELNRQSIPGSLRDKSLSSESCTVINNVKKVWGQPKRPQKRYVKREYLANGYSFRIIKLGNIPFVSSWDISKLLWTSRSIDHLDQKLESANLFLPTEEIVEGQNDELFEQFNSYELGNDENEDSVDKSLIKLFHLKDMLQILKYFGHPSLALRVEVEHVILNFNPKDCLWEYFGVENRPPEPKKSIDPFYRLCFSDLKSTLTKLDYKRRILLRHDPNLNQDVVKAVEIEIKKFQARVSQLKLLFKDDLT